MPESSPASAAEGTMDRPPAAVSDFVIFTPRPEQWDEIGRYLADIQAAAELLPAVDLITDHVANGFDPSWPEGQS